MNVIDILIFFRWVIEDFNLGEKIVEEKCIEGIG